MRRGQPRALRWGLDSCSEVVQLLLSLPSCEIDAIEPLHGSSALAICARDGNVDEVRLLLARGARACGRSRSRQRGRDALSEAMRGRSARHAEIAELLMSQPVAPPTAQDRLNWAKLKSAGRWLGRVACLDLAEEARTFFAHYPGDARAALSYHRDRTWLHGAALCGAARRRGDGGDPRAPRRADAFARDFYGCTPHHYASLYLHEAVLEILPAMGEEELRRGQNPKNLNRQVRKGAYGM